MEHDLNMSQSLSMWSVLHESGTDGAECCRKVAMGEDSYRSFSDLWWLLRVNNLCVQEYYIKPCTCLFYCMEETVVRREKEKSRIKAVKMENLKCFVRCLENFIVLNAWIWDICWVMTGLDEFFVKFVRGMLGSCQSINPRCWRGATVVGYHNTMMTDEVEVFQTPSLQVMGYREETLFLVQGVLGLQRYRPTTLRGYDAIFLFLLLLHFIILYLQHVFHVFL